jgi:hypothetical protein
MEGKLYSFFNLGASCGGWSTPRPGRFTKGKEIRYTLYRRLGGPQGRSGRERKIAPPPRIDPRTVHPVASRYTNWAIPAHITTCAFLFTYINQLVWRGTLEIETRCHIKAITYRLSVAVIYFIFFYCRFQSWRRTRFVTKKKKHVLYARRGWQLRLVHKYGAFKLRRCKHASKCKRAQTSPALTSDLRSAVQSKRPYCCSIKRKKQQQNARGRMPAIILVENKKKTRYETRVYQGLIFLTNSDQT